MPSKSSESNEKDVDLREREGCILPQELMHPILVEACGTLIIERLTIVGRTDTCTDTLLQLSLASRQLYAFATPRLYAWVRLTRPSALKAFQQTLSSRPALGRLVQGLHIGADTPLEKAWWPLTSRGEGITFDLNVDVPGDNRPLSATRALVKLPIDAPAHDPLSAALEAAACGLDVDLIEERENRAGVCIGFNAYTVRMLEAQAAIELYYLYTADHEVTKAPYPRLAVDQTTQPQGEAILRVTRKDLYARMTRAGAPTDSFQHPLLFARSGLYWEAESLDGAERGSHGEEVAQDPADAFAWPPTSDFSQDQVNLSDFSDPLDLDIPATATVAGNIALARSVLAYTPLVRSLSLTGFLNFVLIGERSAPALPNLRGLTVGPPPFVRAFTWGPHKWGLRLHFDRLLTLRKLRLGGSPLGLAEARQLAGRDSPLRNLCELEWSLVSFYDDSGPEDLMSTITQLAGVGETSPLSDEDTAATQQHHFEDKAAYQGGPEERLAKGKAQREQSQGPRQVQSPLRIEARLNISSTECMFDEVEDEGLAAAWRKGTPAPAARNCLKIVAHDEYVRDERLVEQRLYDEGRTFWEEG